MGPPQTNDAPGVASLAVPGSESGSAGREPVEVSIRFADDGDVPFPYRDRSLRTKILATPRTLSLLGHEKALASSEAGPVWTVSEAGGVKHFRSAFPLPAVSTGENLHDVLNGERFLEALPLIHWLREISAGTRLASPPLRAGFIFDDPNLHWPRYGLVDFKEIATHAARDNYHVSFATVPLDGWFTNARAARLFRENPERLSLLVHGNDHTKRELARSYTPAGRVALLRQAIQRIERLEQRTGLRICRVMVPPHGACSAEMLAEMPRCGFEAACISHSSLRAHNRTRSWTKYLGYLPAELIEGCPVMPRWGLDGNTTNRILLAAFLGQSLILRGHHQDLNGGVEVLDKLARFINSLGSVRWGSMTQLARMNYQWQLDKDTLRLRPLGTKLTVRLPDGTESLVIETPAWGAWNIWQLASPGEFSMAVKAGERITLPKGFRGPVSIEVAQQPVAPLENSASRPVAMAFLRRLATEGRDRLLSH